MLNLFRPMYERGVPTECRPFLLKNRITPEQYAAQQQSSTAEWNLDPGDVPKFKSEIDAVVFKRHDNAVRYLMPWIEQITPLKGAHILEIGPGCGSSTLAMSHFAEHVDAIDIDANQVSASQKRMSLFGADNVRVHHTSAEEMVQCALSHLRTNSIILLVGVVEHMTESEQVDLFSRLWQALAPGQIIVIAETPNYYACFDSHTFMRAGRETGKKVTLFM